MEENISLWHKKNEDLTVGDQMKVAGIVTVVSTVAFLGPFWIYGTVLDIRNRRRAKKQKLTLVEDPTDEE